MTSAVDLPCETAGAQAKVSALAVTSSCAWDARWPHCALGALPFFWLTACSLCTEVAPPLF